MKKLTTRLMIATAALVVAAGAASAQVMNASIPFEFHAGGRVMEAGTYRIELSDWTGTRVIWFSNFYSGKQATVLGQVRVDPEKAWIASREGKLAFQCTSGSCVLAEIYAGSGRDYAYKVPRPKLGTGETAVLREIPMHAGKGE